MALRCVVLLAEGRVTLADDPKLELLANLTMPHEWYNLARSIRRKIIIHGRSLAASFQILAVFMHKFPACPQLGQPIQAKRILLFSAFNRPKAACIVVINLVDHLHVPMLCAGPLRLLAWEIHERLMKNGVPCALRTGQGLTCLTLILWFMVGDTTVV